MEAKIKYGRLIETHAHYNLSAFNSNRKELILDLHDMGVERIVIPAIGYESNFDMREKFDKDADYDGIIYYTAGVHPKFVCRLEWDSRYSRTERRELSIAPMIVPLEWDENKDSHIRPFTEKDSAGRLSYIDNRVFTDAIRILKENPIQHGAVMHCFNSSKAVAQEFMAAGVEHFGIGGAIGERASDEFVEMVKWLPLGMLLIETDAPYQKYSIDAPSPVTSETMYQVVARIAEIKNMDPEFVREAAYRNAKRFYNLS
ncbi:MAG: TatD family hydrolase [Clostridium sp.]|uniref:TatD family hydrolase n=1 Tax=Eisenbergiella porci TaxID=2652274 RepID=UPI002912983F|nr:TatD family hydrolase [Clostridium sp.]